MSSIWEASVELASQDTRAIQGVTADNVGGKQVVSNILAEMELRTAAVCEALFAEVNECTLRF